MELRIGLPLTGGYLVNEARAHGIPVLFSANAFAARDDAGRVEIRRPARGRLEGLDASLDSAGFVAMSRYGGYDWTVAQYVGLAAAHAWTWWSQMDCCCEPEIARDVAERRLRIAETAHLYAECAKRAGDQGIAAPMPVLQGWTPDDYRRSMDRLPVRDWPSLVGVGSVCRRDTQGPNGLARVIDALDRVLPGDVRLHLFGVKGSALDVLGRHPRVFSVDSMAWDMVARRQWPTGRTMARRAQVLHAWRATQLARVAMPFPGAQTSLLLDPEDGDVCPGQDSLDEWAELVASGEVDGASAALHWAREAAWHHAPTAARGEADLAHASGF
jgi:hypothetical protein